LGRTLGYIRPICHTTLNRNTNQKKYVHATLTTAHTNRNYNIY